MTISKLFAVAFAVVMLAGCANTIRGAGQDASNTVDASVDAVENVADAAN